MTADERALLIALAHGVAKLLEAEAEVWQEADDVAVEIRRLMQQLDQ